MSDEWYVLSGSMIRGPATAAQLRKSLAEGKIQPETPVRAGTKGAWTFVREIPELGAVPETPSQGLKDSVAPGSPDFTQVGAAPQAAPEGDNHSVVLGSTDLTQVLARRGRSNRQALGRTLVVVAMSGGLLAAILAAIQTSRPREAKNARPTAINADAPPRPTETHEIETARESRPAALPVAEVPEVPKIARTASPVGPSAIVNSRSDDGNSSQRSAPRDNFDIPWPTPQRDAISDQMDWEKLDSIIREYKQLYGQWGQQVQRYKEITGRLTQLANKLQNLQDRADKVSHTMDKIRGIVGDQNADNAEVFAPLETPRYVQSLPKTYTLRAADLAGLGVEAMQVGHNFNTTLNQLDVKTSEQRKTLSRREELRSEWVRITRPFRLWTRQDFPIPVETSTRWILDSDIFAPAYLARCVAEIRDKNYEKALEDIGAAIRRDPFWAELYPLQAVLQNRAGKRVDLDQSLRTIRYLNKKKKSAFVDVCEGIVSARRHNFDGARHKFVSATKDDPSDPTGEAELALLLISHPKTEKRDPAAAVEAATTACKATSWNHWWFLDVLGVSYAAGGDFDRALGCTHRAKEAAPNDVQQLLDERIASYKNQQVPMAVVGDL
jgi:tetratricopeptide (TPR) repeat protein